MNAPQTVQLESEADLLEEAIEILDTIYWTKPGDPTELPQGLLDDLRVFHKSLLNPISDPQYDTIRNRLKKLRPGSRIFKYSHAAKGADPLASGSKKLKHVPPMTSIAKADGDLAKKNKTLTDFMQKCMTKLKYTSDSVNGEPAFAQSYKRDGVSCRLYYEKGRLVHAGVRPQDGINGCDIIEHVKYVKGVAFNLPVPMTGSITGELEILLSNFEKVQQQRQHAGENPFANTRAATVGTMNPAGDPSVVKDRHVTFIGHSIQMDNPPYKTAIERAKWCNTVLKVPFVRVMPFNYADLAKMESQVTDQANPLQYEVDGVVIEVNNLLDSDSLGNSGGVDTGDPHGKIAWKFNEQRAKPTVKELVWQPGRFKITPVAKFDAVRLAGTNVTNCTCHNVMRVINLGIGPGAVILMYKAGKIIPFLEAVITKSTKVSYPSTCPGCGAPTAIEGEELVCTSDTCPAKHMAAYVHYLHTFGVKGVGESIIESLTTAGLVKGFADLYKLTPENIQTAGFSDRESLLTYARIHMVNGADQIKDNTKLRGIADAAAVKRKQIPLAQLIAALGIPGASKGTGRDLAAHFRDFDKIRLAAVSDLESVANIGNSTAQSIHQYFAQHSVAIDELQKFVEPEKPASGKFNNLTFVFTGGHPEGKDYWAEKAEAEGAKVSSSVSKKTHFVVVGSDPGAKLEKAEELAKLGEMDDVRGKTPVLHSPKGQIIDRNGIMQLLGIPVDDNRTF